VQPCLQAAFDELERDLNEQRGRPGTQQQRRGGEHAAAPSAAQQQQQQQQQGIQQQRGKPAAAPQTKTEKLRAYVEGSKGPGGAVQVEETSRPV
jgi:hypothetical protein